MKKRAVWGIVGSGCISHDFVLALKANQSVIRFVAARKRENAEQFAAEHEIPFFGTVSDLLEEKEVNIVYVGTIHPAHFEQCKQLLLSGFNVLCEKPMAMNVKQTLELIEIARSRHLFLSEGMWTRHFPVTKQIRDIIISCSLGKPIHVIADFGFKAPDEPGHRVWDKRLGGGALLDIGCYPLAWAILAFGAKKMPEIKAVAALKNGVDASASVSLMFDDGLASVSYSFLGTLPEKTVICFEEGYVEIVGAHAPTDAKVTSFACRTSSQCKHISYPLERYKECEGIPNFPNSEGFIYEVQQVEYCIENDLKETKEFSLEESLLLAKIMMEIRTQIGVEYDADNH